MSQLTLLVTGFIKGTYSMMDKVYIYLYDIELFSGGSIKEYEPFDIIQQKINTSVDSNKTFSSIF